MQSFSQQVQMNMCVLSPGVPGIPSWLEGQTGSDCGTQDDGQVWPHLCFLSRCKLCFSAMGEIFFLMTLISCLSSEFKYPVELCTTRALHFGTLPPASRAPHLELSLQYPDWGKTEHTISLVGLARNRPRGGGKCSRCFLPIHVGCTWGSKTSCFPRKWLQRMAQSSGSDVTLQ